MATIMVSAGRCQFCHRTAAEGLRVIAGDSGFICDECVRACATLLAPNDAKREAAEYSERYAFQRLIRHFAPGARMKCSLRHATFPIRQQADLQQALDATPRDPRVPENFVGIHAQSRHEAIGFSKLLARKPILDRDRTYRSMKK